MLGTRIGPVVSYSGEGTPTGAVPGRRIVWRVGGAGVSVCGRPAAWEAPGEAAAAAQSGDGCFGGRGDGGGNLPRRRPRSSARRAVALSLGAALWPAAAMASPAVLLSNLDEGDGTSIVVGTPADSPREFAQAIRFQTGSSERGYNLTSVKAVLADAAPADGVRVRIFNSRSNGNPYYSLYTLTNPAISDGTLTFTPPASATVRPDTLYFVLFDSTASGAGNDYEIAGTESDSLNSAATGWSLHTDRHAGNGVSLSWTTHGTVPLIEINGDALTEATDATLSALSIDDGVKRFTTLLSPSFDPSTTAYTSSAASLIDQLTIEPTASNADGAEVTYLDGSDLVLSDADAEKDGFQVDLAVGDNRIQVKVTAADGTTTRTYTLAITRAELLGSPHALIGNLDEPLSQGRFIGTKDGFTFAQGFETGDQEAGYALTSVKIIVTQTQSGARLRVRIFNSTAGGLPQESIHSLGRAPNGIGVRTFEAPSNATLEASTRYFVVIDSDASNTSKACKISVTSSDFQNSVAPGWSMDSDRLVHTSDRDWYTDHRVPLLEINGEAVVPSSDASLSGLGLTWDDGGTATAIALNPAFVASTTDYAGSVGSGVDRITIDGTKSDDDTEVSYRDGTDSALADADGNATGFQVDLDLGVNTIKVHVTAADGETTETYSVTVARGSVAPVWSTTLTVGGDSSGLGFSSLPNPDVGRLADDTFEHAGLTRRVQIVAASSAGVTFRTRNGGDTFGGLVLGWAGEVLPLDDATRSSNTFTWNQAWLTANASSLNAANYETTLPADGTTPVCLRDDRQSCSSALAGLSAPNQAPEFDDGSSASRSVAENAAAGTAVGTPVSATDDDGDTLAYVLAGTDAGDFSIDTSTGQLHTAAALDHEAGSSRSVSVTASDGNGGSAAIPVTVLVTDVDEPPDAPPAPTVAGASSTSLSVSWSAPANAGRPVLSDYDVQYRAGAVGAFADWAHAGTATSATITGLSADTAYQVQVLARNAEGASAWSATGEGRTEADETLTGRFENVPSAHNGSSAFTLELAFSEAVFDGTESFDKNRAIRDALQVTGGTLRGGRRTDPGVYDRWRLRIEPSGRGDVTVTLPATTGVCGSAGAICTPDGRPLSAPASATIVGPDDAADGDVRLVGGTSVQEGRVEVHHDGVWGTVCDDRFTAEDAAAVCRQLGYAGGEARRRAAFGEGTGTVWMDDVQCAGGEARLADCPFAGWGVHNCRHSEDVGVSCGAASSLSFASATVAGPVLTLRYDRSLRGGSVPSPSDFVVVAGPADDAAAVPVESVAVVDGAAALTLSRPVVEPENVSVSYLPAAMHPLQDTSYNPVPAMTGEPVRHARWVARDDIAARDLSGPAPLPETGSWSGAKVEVLDLSVRGLSDVSSLAGLQDVELLDLGGNRVGDLGPLAAMAGLEVLDLRDNAVSDLSPLAGLAKLRDLDLSDNDVSDLWPLSGLYSLERLNLSGNSVTDIEALAALSNLTVLLLDGNAVTDLGPLTHLSALENLGLAGNRIGDLTALQGLRRLRRLDLTGNPAVDLSPLGDIRSLVWLALPEHRVGAAAETLGRLTELGWVWYGSVEAAGEDARAVRGRAPRR